MSCISLGMILSILAYLSVDSSDGPEMISGGARFVDENGVHFVDDGELVSALHAMREVVLHIVAEVVEAEFVLVP